MKKNSHWTTLREESIKELANGKAKPKIFPKTSNQAKYIRAIERSVVTICNGLAGTGKTLLACSVAAQMLKEGKVERIVVSRPLLECDEETGTLPGDMWEKIVDMMAPMFDALEFFYCHKEIEELKKEKKLIVVPLAKMRGSTFRNSFVILDEAQNATYRQLKMFLTRFGENSRVVVCGDHTQSDIKSREKNSLREVTQRLRFRPHSDISIVELGREDICRHPLIQLIDECLSDDIEDGYYSDSISQVRCPGCQKKVFYDSLAEKLNLLVECWSCSGSIDVIDEAGKVNPIIVDEPPEIKGISLWRPQ
jgi:phosphate starvation-inducible protein PhoH and related proteins